MHIEIYKDKSGEWRWKAFAENGQVIGDSGEGYKNRKDCTSMAELMFPLAEIVNSDREFDES